MTKDEWSDYDDTPQLKNGVGQLVFVRNKIEKLFKELRMDTNYHLGLGDIRLTVAQQDRILKLIGGKHV